MKKAGELSAIKYAHSEADALAFIGTVLDKRNPNIRKDKRRNLLTILSIETI
jgi:hypothetical protein